MKIFIETYGCAANQSHSEKLAGFASNIGYVFTDSEKDADAIILNTCVVKKQTEQKILDRIKSIRKNSPEKKIVLAGCLPKIPEILKKADYDGIINETGNPASALNRLLGCEHATVKEMSSHNAARNGPVIHIEEVAEGCLGSCSYCIVRRAKGALKSESANKIVRNIENAAKDGCKEVWLTAQDTACYGLDFDKGSNLPELIGSICNIDSDFSLRIGMMNPEHALKMLPELIESYRNEKVYKFLHLPVQSGSDIVLEKMNRRYRAEDFLKIISEFRKAFPRIQIWTDIIVGFPGESEKDFEETIKLMEKTRPDFVNISQFGPRPGTPAEKMEQVPGEIKKERSKKLSEMLKKIYLENNKKWIGWEGKVLAIERSKTGFLARNFAYKPVQIKSDKDIIGKTVNVKITRAGSSALFGEING